MANDQVTHQAKSGLALYFTVRNDAGEIWSVSGGAFETHVAANWGNYDTALTESPADSGKYLGTLPAAIPPGRYTIDVHWQRWQAPYHADEVIDSQVVEWGGSEITPPTGYAAHVKLTIDAVNTQDEYTVVWVKDLVPVVTGITSPLITVYKRDGTTLVGETAMTQAGAIGAYKYDEDTNRTTPGESVVVEVKATIDGAVRTWRMNVSRDTQP
jgi:hypothetical protein